MKTVKVYIYIYLRFSFDSPSYICGNRIIIIRLSSLHVYVESKCGWNAPSYLQNCPFFTYTIITTIYLYTYIHTIVEVIIK